MNDEIADRMSRINNNNNNKQKSFLNNIILYINFNKQMRYSMYVQLIYQHN